MSDDPIDPLAKTDADVLLGGGGQTSLLDAVDGLLERGVMLEGDLVLGLADVDLIYLRLSTLLAAADRILRADGGMPHRPTAPPPPPPEGREAPEANDAPEAAEATGAAGAADREVAGVDALRERLEESLGRGEPRSEPPAAPEPPAGEDPEPVRIQAAGATGTPRWNASPEDVERSVARLVLALVEFLRQLLERQAIRRMEQGTLSEEEVERLGRALMRLEETVHDMARRFGLDPEDLNLDLGPLGNLT
jgi:hypothetical protein